MSRKAKKKMDNSAEKLEIFRDQATRLVISEEEVFKIAECDTMGRVIWAETTNDEQRKKELEKHLEEINHLKQISGLKQELREEIDKLFKANPDACIHFLDDKRFIRYCSPALERLFGAKESPLTDIHANDFFWRFANKFIPEITQRELHKQHNLFNELLDLNESLPLRLRQFFLELDVLAGNNLPDSIKPLSEVRYIIVNDGQYSDAILHRRPILSLQGELLGWLITTSITAKKSFGEEDYERLRKKQQVFSPSIASLEKTKKNLQIVCFVLVKLFYFLHPELRQSNIDIVKLLNDKISTMPKSEQNPEDAHPETLLDPHQKGKEWTKEVTSKKTKSSEEYYKTLLKFCCTHQQMEEAEKQFQVEMRDFLNSEFEELKKNNIRTDTHISFRILGLDPGTNKSLSVDFEWVQDGKRDSRTIGIARYLKSQKSSIFSIAR